MRFLLVLSTLAFSGCHLWGGGETCPPNGHVAPAACASEAACETACGEDCPADCCEDGGCGICILCMKRHPHYRRVPDNCLTRMQARCRAQKDLHRLKGDPCVTCDYRLGYEQAFVDVAMGSCGEVPALPPANYWKVCARTPQGHRKAQAWFSGYAAGAVRAKGMYEPYNKVAHSQFQTDPWYGYQSDCNVEPGVDPALQNPAWQ